VISTNGKREGREGESRIGKRKEGGNERKRDGQRE
jgi:hypothetical protein